MKKSIAAFIVSMIFLLAGNAQEQSVTYNPGPMAGASAKSKNALRTLAQIKAEKFFLNTNKDAENPYWSILENGFQVSYLINGKQGRSFFNKKGNFQFSILSYSEKYMPLNIRSRVKSVFYLDYKITNVTEINHTDLQTTLYIVCITDGKEWKKIRISNDEMEVIETFPVM